MDDETKEAATADEQQAGFLAAPRYREQESLAPGVGETFLGEVVDDTLRSILDRRGWPEHIKLQARYHASVIASGMQAVRSAPNRDFVLNLVWAALSLGLTSGHSAEWEERVARERGKKSAVARDQKSKGWKTCATEMALSLRSKNPTLSQHDIADKIALEWKNKCFAKVGHSRLVQFISELERAGEVPQRSRSLS
jgi:hypothetical protein